MKGRVVLKLGKLVSFRTGKLDSNAAKQNGSYPFFTCSQQTLRTDTYSFDTECVLLAGNNANGIYPLKYFSGKFDAYQRTYVICSLDATLLLNRYLYYALRLQLDRLKSISTGAATKFLTLTLLNELEVEVPDIATQERIVGIVSAYDELIEYNTRRIKILEEMAQALYREWFVHFRFGEHEKTRLIESTLGRIPHGWRVGRLDDALVLQRGFDLPKKERKPGTVPIYASTGCVGTHSAFKAKGPGIVTGRSGSLGTVIYIEEDFWPLNTTLWVREFRAASPFYSFYLLRDLGLGSFNSGAAVPTLNRNDIHGLPVILPTESILRRFDALIQPLFDMKRNLTAKNKSLTATRALLLPKLISGEVELR